MGRCGNGWRGASKYAYFLCTRIRNLPLCSCCAVFSPPSGSNPQACSDTSIFLFPSPFTRSVRTRVTTWVLLSGMECHRSDADKKTENGICIRSHKEWCSPRVKINVMKNKEFCSSQNKDYAYHECLNKNFNLYEILYSYRPRRHPCALEC